MRQILIGLSPFKQKSTTYVRGILGAIAVTLCGFTSVAHAQVPVTGVTKITAGYSHTCVLTISGGVKCWGDNQYGQLGVGETTRYSVTAVDVIGLQSGVIAVAAGGSHSCALTSAGAVKCWGSNSAYQVGDGTSQPRYTPVNVSGLSGGVIAIAATSAQSCALTSAGAVKCWGYNNFAYRTTPVDISGLGADIVAITTGVNHLCGLTNLGGVKCWGYNVYGQLGGGSTSSQSSAVDVVGLSSGVVAVEAGGHHTCALLNDGTAKCWGYNAWGQLGDPEIPHSAVPLDLPNSGDGIASISTGYASSCLVTVNGAVKCWGSNAGGQLGNNTTVGSPVIGDVFGLGSDVSFTDVGSGHACSLGNAGNINCWGSNSYGKLGDGTTLQRLIPSPANPVSSTLPLNCPAVAMSIGTSASGVWGQVGDCTAGIRGSTFKTDAYTFSGQAGRKIAISVTRSGTFNPYVYLRDANGLVIAEDDDGYYNPVSTSTPDARIPAKWGYFTLPASGTYTIEVTTSTETNADPQGSYTLSLTSDTASSSSSSTSNVCNPVAITGFGITLSGTLTNTDCRSGARGTSYYTDRHSFSGVAGQLVAISLNSSAFDAYVYLKSVSDTVLTSNDDGGGGGNSRIPASGGFYVLPATGTYIVEATSYGTVATGAYTLIVSTAASSSSSSSLSSISSSRSSSSSLSSLASSSSLSSSSSTFSSSAGVSSNSSLSSSSSLNSSSSSSSSSNAASNCSVVAISAGTSYNYTLSSADCASGTRGTSYYTDRYSFNATAGQQISIQLNSSAFDTFVYLKNTTGTAITFNDDSGGTTNSRIPVTSGLYTLPAVSGTYEIEVTSYATLRTGSYSLLLTQQ